MNRFNDSARLSLRDIAWMCEQRDPQPMYRVEPKRHPRGWPLGGRLIGGHDRRSGCSAAVMPDDSIVVVPHDIDPLVSMAMSLAVVEAWNQQLAEKIVELEEKRTA